tara:strand:- start:253 stop:474 length:222 start_codon:yes stop_codon:yes gene_type:complete
MTYDQLILRVSNALAPILDAIDIPEGKAVHVEIAFSEGAKPSLDEITIATGLTLDDDGNVKALEHLLLDRRMN